MSWYCHKTVKCKKCNKEYEQSIDTISICAGQDKACKYCGGELEHIDNEQGIEEYFNKNKEDFKNRRKRIISNCYSICDFNCNDCEVSKFNKI